MKVLIADDDLRLRRMLESFLTKTGWSVEIATTAEEAMEKLDDSLDVVLSDIKMGELSGIDLLRLIREKHPFLEVILMTGFADLQDSIEALNLRAFNYLKKPFDLTELNQSLLEASRAKDANIREEYYKRSLEEQVERQTSQLRIEKERFQTIFSTVPTMLLVFDRRLSLVDGNSFLEQFIGRPVSQLAGEHLGTALNCANNCCSSQLSELPDNCQLIELIRPVMEDRMVFRSQLHLDILQEGLIKPFIFRGSCCRLRAKTEDETLFLLMLEDITHEIELEVQLLHSSRMSALGEMASGVAHELNQPLNGIAGCIQLMESWSSSGKNISPDKRLGVFRDMLDEVNRMSEIINNMRIFSRSDKVTRRTEPVDVKAAYHNSMKLLRTQIEKHGIEVEENIPEKLPLVSGDNGRLQQVFMNLLINARDALSDSEPTDSDQDEKQPRKIIHVVAGTQAKENKSGVLFAIQDNGTGILTQNLRSIFDPFFSTKAPGKGTGLGLAISYGIIKDFGGSIEVISEPGEGAKFSIWLPCYSEKVNRS
jgi:signal transduction histidine kinase